jgi:hypothetical protein
LRFRIAVKEMNYWLCSLTHLALSCGGGGGGERQMLGGIAIFGPITMNLTKKIKIKMRKI